MGCLIVFHSMTHAQRAAAVLVGKGVSANITRPPLELGKGSCSAALRISNRQLSSAVKLISKLSFRPVGVYCYTSDKQLQEVKP